MKNAFSFGIAIALLSSSACLAGPQNISSELREQAIQNCGGDAVRLCPQSLTDEGQAVSCLATKRPQLSQSCRVVYDQVARLLKD